MTERFDLEIFDAKHLPTLSLELQGKALAKCRGMSQPVNVRGVINQCGIFDTGSNQVHFKTGDLILEDSQTGRMWPLSQELFASQYGENSIHLCPVLD